MHRLQILSDLAEKFIWISHNVALVISGVVLVILGVARASLNPVRSAELGGVGQVTLVLDTTRATPHFFGIKFFASH